MRTNKALAAALLLFSLALGKGLQAAPSSPPASMPASMPAAMSAAMPARALPPGGPVAVCDSADLLLGADPGLGIEELSADPADPRFTPVAGRQVYSGRDAPATWLRFSLDGAGSGGGDWLLEVRPSFSIILDEASLFLPVPGGGYAETKAGARLRARPGEAPSRYFLFELPASALSGAPCYLRLASETDVETRVFAWPALAYARRALAEGAAYGLIYGVLAAMLLYNAFLFFALRDGSILRYIGFVAFAFLWTFFVQGHAKALFGPRPGLDQAALWFCAGGMLAFGALFAAAFLEMRRGSKAAYAALLALAALGAASALAGAAGLDRAAFLVSHYLGLALPVLIVAAAALRLAQGFQAALYFLVAWACLVLGGLAFALMGLKALPVGFWTTNGVSIGLAAESVLLAVAIADRYRRLEREKLSLERREARYRELSLRDGLTGLYNKRHLETELRAEVARSAEGGTPLSAIFLDIDDFKAVNDSHGHALGDEMLAALAATVLASVRERDEAFRFGGEEFVVLMPGIRAADAFLAAERIRERFARDSRREAGGAEVSATVSLGVAELLPGEGGESFLRRADDAMYEAKRLGKDRTVLGRA